MYDLQREDSRATLIAAIILVILLAGVVAFTSPAAEPDDDGCRFASAISDTSIAFAEVSNPVEQIDRLGDMGLLRDMAELLTVIGGRGGLPSLQGLGAALDNWDADPGLRSDLESIAGQQAACVLLKSQETRWPMLLALRGTGGADRLGALASLATRFGLGTLAIEGSSPAIPGFSIGDERGNPVLDGRLAGDWMVLGPPGTGEAAAELAGCLAGWAPCPMPSICSLPAFKHALAMLPDTAPMRGFLNPPQIGAPLNGAGEPARSLLLGWTDGIAFSREITDQGIETRAAGRFSPVPEDESQNELFASLASIGEPLSSQFPDGALAAYELGVPPAEIVTVLARYLETLFPEIHAAARGVLDDFTAATGLDPASGLLAFLDRGIAVGVLPPENDLQGWPFPRPVILLRSTDDAAVRRFLEAWLRWEAGALAPTTQGLFGAWMDSQRFAGTQLTGLRLDSVLATPIPLPSPTFAVVDGLVIASPLRSTVAEIVGDRAEKKVPAAAGANRTAAVETVWLNLPAWPEAWQRAEDALANPSFERIPDPQPVIDVGRSLMRLLGGFGAARGTTTVTPDGDFIFHAAVSRSEDAARRTD